MRPIYFSGPDEWRAWLAEHHATATEVLVGFHKTSTGKASLTWAQSVDQALCFGWIDGVRRGVDAGRYTIRFTPRRARSNWSAVNIKRVGELVAEGLIQPAGLAAFEAGKADNSRHYSYETGETTLDPAYEKELREDKTAWAFWTKQPPGYRKTATWLVMSPKREDTRRRRFDELKADSHAGRRIARLRRPES